MPELIEVHAAKEFANTFLSDPVMDMTVSFVLENTPRFDLVRCRECKKEWCYLRQELGPNGFCSAGERENNGFRKMETEKRSRKG